jgi:ribosomal protein S12 methylthiotransferase accessory factor
MEHAIVTAVVHASRAAMGPVPAPTLPASPVPLTAAAAALEAALAAVTRRDSNRGTESAGGLYPRVVPLGAVDVTVSADDYAPSRRAANVHLTPDAVLVGPFGGASDGPCGRCLAIRWQRLRAEPVRDALEQGGRSLAAGRWPLLTELVVDTTWALLEALAQTPAGSVAKVARLDLGTLRARTVELLTEPTCPAHGRQVSPTLRLRTRPKAATNGYRFRAPDAYGLPPQALVNPVCGVLGPTTVQDVTAPTTAAVSGRYFERGRDGLNEIGWSGKADSFAASRDLAFLEGLERYAGTRPRGRPEIVVDSLANLGETALDPRQCGEYPEETYGCDPTLRRFSPQDRIPWVWGHSLRDDSPTLVPLRSAYYGMSSPVDDFVFECSNGCATGSCPEEAVLFGLLELIERDAFLLGWYSGEPTTAIDLSTVPGRTVRLLVDRAALHGYDVHAFDSRVDLSVPVVTCLAVRRDGGLGTLAFAAGASLDPAQAVEAALGEALTYLPHFPAQARARRAELELMATDFGRVAALGDHSLLFALPGSAVHARRYLEPERRLTFEEMYAGQPQTTDLLEDLESRCGRSPSRSASA